MAHLDLEQFDPNALTAQRSERDRSFFHTQRMLFASAIASLFMVIAAGMVMSWLS